MHLLKPQCIVFVAKAPEVEGIKFRKSDYTATRVRKMALDVMRRCSSADAHGKTVVLGGCCAVGMNSFVDVARFPERIAGM